LIHSAHLADIFLKMDCYFAGKLLNMRQKSFSERPDLMRLSAFLSLNLSLLP